MAPICQEIDVNQGDIWASIFINQMVRSRCSEYWINFEKVLFVGRCNFHLSTLVVLFSINFYLYNRTTEERTRICQRSCSKGEDLISTEVLSRLLLYPWYWIRSCLRPAQLPGEHTVLGCILHATLFRQYTYRLIHQVPIHCWVDRCLARSEVISIETLEIYSFAMLKRQPWAFTHPSTNRSDVA